MKNYFWILILASFCISCEKYLDVKSDAKQIVPSTLQDFQYLMDNAADMNNTTPGYGCSSADNYFLTDVSYNSKSVFFQNVYKWSPYPYKFQNDWSFCYKAIYNVNLILERLSLVKRETSNAVEFDRIEGSALFYRSWYNLELAWQFAKAYDAGSADTDLGIPLRNSTDFLLPSMRSSVQQTYEKILEDAKAAALLLPGTALFATRPSRGAAFGLLARTYLSMRMYDSAFRYADMALQIKADLLNYNDPAQVAVTATNPFKLFNKEVVFQTTMGVWISIYHPSSGPARIDTALFASFHINDLRRKAFFTAVSPYQRFKGSYSGSTSRLFSGIATDELYLTRAECRARAGEKEAALNDLNSLLQQRFAPATFVPVTAVTASEALEVILIERRKELMFRGSLRWMDIKRFNKEGRNIELKRKIMNDLIVLLPNDSRYALPLPQDVLETSGMEQN